MAGEIPFRAYAERDLDPGINLLLTVSRFVADPAPYRAELRDRLSTMGVADGPAATMAECAQAALDAMDDAGRAAERPARMWALRDAMQAYCATFPKAPAATDSRRTTGPRPPRFGSGRGKHGGRPSFVDRAQAKDGDGDLDPAQDF
ncbi:hypothetical protein [Nitrospirillum iridis]|uniref:Uncharacterized protein n=1 Tax=Nitrospirillum iridis TaxID=765888 RepID=A0A7X0EC73_9PROT|nr:hypothetical protein [Nitrospirillum iridis]MBB6251412.1 hypothetical protein [Nitrospirillum iridis]